MQMNEKFLIEGVSPQLLARVVAIVKTSKGYEFITQGRRFKAEKREG